MKKKKHKKAWVRLYRYKCIVCSKNRGTRLFETSKEMICKVCRPLHDLENHPNLFNGISFREETLPQDHPIVEGFNKLVDDITK